MFVNAVAAGQIAGCPDAAESGKRRYESPNLHNFGRVTDKTLAGGGSNNECGNNGLRKHC